MRTSLLLSLSLAAAAFVPFADAAVRTCGGDLDHSCVQCEYRRSDGTCGNERVCGVYVGVVGGCYVQ